MRILPTLIAVAMILSAGIVHGLVSGRWGDPRQLDTALGRLETVPASFGDWTSEDLTIPESQLRIGEIDGYISRIYRHPDGRAVNLLIVGGRPGPISVHTPDICFQGAGFRMRGTPQTRSVPLVAGEPPVELQTADFTKSDAALTTHLRVFWGWSAAGAWTAPSNPRLAFAGHPYLFKMYLTRALGEPGESLDDDVSLQFLHDLMPHLRRDLFPQSKTNP